MRTLYGTVTGLLLTPGIDIAVVALLLETTVTNWPGADDVFGSDSTVTLAGDRVVELTVCPEAATGRALITASGVWEGDLTPAGRTVTILRGGLALQLGTVNAGPTINVGWPALEWTWIGDFGTTGRKLFAATTSLSGPAESAAFGDAETTEVVINPTDIVVEAGTTQSVDVTEVVWTSTTDEAGILQVDVEFRNSQLINSLSDIWLVTVSISSLSNVSVFTTMPKSITTSAHTWYTYTYSTLTTAKICSSYA